MLLLVNLSLVEYIHQQKIKVLGEKSSSKLLVDAYTQKEYFNGKGVNKTSDTFSPLELIVVYAFVAYNDNPVSNIIVTFTVKGPPNPLKNVTFIFSEITMPVE